MWVEGEDWRKAGWFPTDLFLTDISHECYDVVSFIDKPSQDGRSVWDWIGMGWMDWEAMARSQDRISEISRWENERWKREESPSKDWMEWKGPYKPRPPEYASKTLPFSPAILNVWNFWNKIGCWVWREGRRAGRRGRKDKRSVLQQSAAQFFFFFLHSHSLQS